MNLHGMIVQQAGLFGYLRCIDVLGLQHGLDLRGMLFGGPRLLGHGAHTRLRAHCQSERQREGQQYLVQLHYISPLCSRHTQDSSKCHAKPIGGPSATTRTCEPANFFFLVRCVRP